MSPVRPPRSASRAGTSAPVVPDIARRAGGKRGGDCEDDVRGEDGVEGRRIGLGAEAEGLNVEDVVEQVVEAMTMAGLEVEEVLDPAAKLAPFTVARIISAERHPNADRLQVCQVETVDGIKEIVCGAPNARAGLTTIYAPIGAYVPGLGVTLVEKPVRGVVSNGMLCSASELELADESDGIQELPPEIPVGTPVAGLFGAEPVIDFEVTPNRPDWLGVAGIARDLAAAGVGKLKHFDIAVVRGGFPSPISVRLDAPEMCPVFAGRVIRGVKNGPSPAWLQKRLTAIGLRSINRLVDVTNLIAYDRARPLHVYDLAKLSGTEIVVRGGQVSAGTAHIEGGEPEHLIALDGKTYAVSAADCVIADAGGERRRCRNAKRPASSCWSDALRTADL